MKDYLRQLLEETKDPLRGRNVVREYLQVRILGSFQRAGAMRSLAFHGGTALRVLFAIPRYSEDLDFTLEGPDYELRDWLRAVRSEMEAEGYALAIRLADRRTVHSAWLRFGGLLHELELSPHRGEVLAVKVEVDTNPPAGVVLETRLVRRHVLLRVRHHDRASLLAGKLHAVLQRPFVKGRDLFDLAWYLSAPDWPAPNLTLLNHALVQTGWRSAPLTEATWRKAVSRRIREIEWERAVEDVRPFLEREADVALMDREEILRTI